MTTTSFIAAAPPASVVTEAVAIESLTYRYGKRVALKEVSFSVRQGEMFVLLGPNGSGKTTLFRILSTLVAPQDGSAAVLNMDVTHRRADVRRHIGVVFQSQSLDLKLTCAENLRHQGHLYGLRGDRLIDRSAEMLDRLGLADRARDRAEALSGGLRRRLEIAKGLLHRPAVLLLDEPTTGLDPAARRELWNYLAALRESEGTTVLFTTHLMDEADQCDRVAILHDGGLVALGTPAELKSEIGGDIVTLESSHPEVLAAKLRARFDITAVVLDEKLRCEIRNGHRFAADAVEAFPGEIRFVMVSKPSLEDVFIRRTGHRFRAGERGYA